MPHAMLDRMKIDPGHRTLGELLQERQWALQEIGRLMDDLARLASRRAIASDRVDGAQTTSSVDLDDPLASRRLLRLADVAKLAGLSRSTIYKMVGEGRFPAGVHFGPRTVRWHTKDILAWQNRLTE
jgi:excisionase family DNA binding protein